MVISKNATFMRSVAIQPSHRIICGIFAKRHYSPFTPLTAGAEYIRVLIFLLAH